MVDHSTRAVNVAELANTVEELRRKVCELDTRIGNTPRPIPGRLVPRAQARLATYSALRALAGCLAAPEAARR